MSLSSRRQNDYAELRFLRRNSMNFPILSPTFCNKAIQWPLAAIVFFLISNGTLSAVADIAVLDRFSELRYDSTNLGGESGLSSTTSPLDTFDEIFSGSKTHIEPGGKINTGIWFLNQNSSITDTLIAFQGETTSSMTGNGSGILELSNTFEIEFKSIGMTAFELSGSLFGSIDPPNSADFARVQLLEFNGVTFVPMFSTGAGDDLSDGFAGTFDAGNEYRLEVFSRNFTNSGTSNTSGATVNLVMESVPEPSSVILLGLLGICGLRRRRFCN